MLQTSALHLSRWHDYSVKLEPCSREPQPEWTAETNSIPQTFIPIKPIMSLNSEQDKKKKKRSLISTDLLPFSPYDPSRALQKRRDGNAKWKYWIELLSPPTRCHNIFPTDSPQSVQQLSKKGDKYGQNTSESGPGGKKVTSNLNILKIQSSAPNPVPYLTKGKFRELANLHT